MTSETRVDNPWREFIENVVNGDNFFRTQEYYNLIEYIDGLLIERQAVAELIEAAGELVKHVRGCEILLKVDEQPATHRTRVALSRITGEA